jgi:hypothetical protein
MSRNGLGLLDQAIDLVNVIDRNGIGRVSIGIGIHGFFIYEVQLTGFLWFVNCFFAVLEAKFKNSLTSGTLKGKVGSDPLAVGVFKAALRLASIGLAIGKRDINLGDSTKTQNLRKATAILLIDHMKLEGLIRLRSISKMAKANLQTILTEMVDELIWNRDRLIFVFGLHGFTFSSRSVY